MSQNTENIANTDSVSAETNSIVWKYNDFEAEFDITDLDTSEKYEKTFEIMGEKEKKLPKVGKQSEMLKAQFEWFSETFDRLFGEGSSNKILGGKKSVNLCLEAYMSFLDFVKRQKENVLNKRETLTSSYANRAQRRASAKKK